MINKIFKIIISKIDILIVIFALTLGFYLKWHFQDVMIFCFLIWLVLRPVSSKTILKYSMLSLAASALLMIVKRREIAADFASYSFYFLAFATIMIMKEIYSRKKEHE